jgi:hypothetical protein
MAVVLGIVAQSAIIELWKSRRPGTQNMRIAVKSRFRKIELAVSRQFG